MKEWLKNNYKYCLVICLIVIVMTFFMTQKEGFHEDELFSYGSSNYYYDNVFRRYGRSDGTNVFMKERIVKGNIVDIAKNVKHEFIDNNQNFQKYLDDFDVEKHPVWRTRTEAQDYLTIKPSEILNYPLVYYNQSRDVHPPLFYFAIHTVCIFFFGCFTKYSAYIINVIFMILSLWIIKKIFEIIEKKHLIIPGLILYGLSMGAISTAIFLRMYSMVTFFGLWFLLENIRIIQNDYVIDKKQWIKLGIITILGFLTQYYFCIIAVIMAGIIFVKICLKKDKKGIVKYILNYAKIALLGVLIFPASIYHIFFSYRGVNDAIMERPYLDKLSEYFSLTRYAIGFPLIIFACICLIAIGFIIYKRFKNNEKIDNVILMVIIMLGVSIIAYIPLIAKVSPELEYQHTLRYIMPILPMMTIMILLVIDMCFKGKEKITEIGLIVVTLVISICGLVMSKPSFLYKGYNKYLEIAQKNKELRFVYVGDAGFCHMQSMQEFATYKESLIVYENELDYVINDEKLKNENEFILSIKKYKDDNKVLEKIVEETDFKNYELLLDDNGEVGCKIYKMKR